MFLFPGCNPLYDLGVAEVAVPTALPRLTILVHADPLPRDSVSPRSHTTEDFSLLLVALSTLRMRLVTFF